MEYMIGDFSKISRLSIKTLRYYHECGLLAPVRIDNTTGYRFYDENSLERVRIIEELKDFEFSLKEIKSILENCSDDSDIKEYIVSKAEEVKGKIQKYNEIDKKLEAFIYVKLAESTSASFIEHSGKEEDLNMANRTSDIIIKNIPDIISASIRFKGKYMEVGKIFSKIYKNCGRYSAGAPFSLYYDNDYKDEDADIEVCVPVKKIINEEGIECKMLKGGKAITILHKGSYDLLGESYKTLIDYINSSNSKIIAPSREVYLKGPGIILPRNPKKYITEIQMLIEE